MSKAGYIANTEAAIALAAATAKTVLSVIAPAQFGVDLIGFDIAFDGVTSTAVPVLVEVVRFTGADGTGTAGTVQQQYGRAIAAGFTTKHNYTAEPSTPELLREFLLTPNGGTFSYDWSLGQSPDCDVSDIIGIRVTAPAIVNCRASMRFERA